MSDNHERCYKGFSCEFCKCTCHEVKELKQHIPYKFGDSIKDLEKQAKQAKKFDPTLNN